jgi:putative ABC transport system permease protein
MLNKLALRNARRSARDYLVYLVTMTIIASLMFAFNAMIFSRDIIRLFQVAGIMAAMIGIATFFILLIVAWLVHYMVNFMLEKRSREFGTYMLMGMKKKQIARMFLRENMLLGLMAFILGILPGIFLQQVLTTIFYRIFDKTYHLSLSFTWQGFLLTAGLYTFVFLFALVRNKRRFKKMNIHDLIYLDRQNQQFQKKQRSGSRFLFYAALLYYICFAVILFSEAYTVVTIWFYLLGLVAASYLLFIGLSGFVVHTIVRKNKKIYKGANLFILRQLSSKIKTMSFTMGTLTVLFFAALVGCSVAMMFGDYQKKQLDDELPFDVIAFSDNPEDDFSAQLSVLKKETQITEQLIYQIYQDGTDTMNQYLYETLPYFDGKAPEFDEDAGTVSNYFSYDTYMKLSDYNSLRRMLGYSQISLGPDEYLIHTKERLKDNFREFQGTADSKGLICKGIYTEPFAQSGENGADYILVIPDGSAAHMTPFYSLLACDIAGDAPEGLQEKLSDTQNYTDPNTGKTTMDIIWGYGTNEVVTMSDTILVQTNVRNEIRFILTAVSYPLFYLALVFLCVALTILSVQQLSDASKYRFRYQVLSKLGLKEKEVDRVILKQLLIYYLCPFLAAIVISAVIAIFGSSEFLFYTGLNTSVFYYYGISLLPFCVIYALYFMATYISFKRNVHTS